MQGSSCYLIHIYSHTWPRDAYRYSCGTHIYSPVLLLQGLRPELDDPSDVRCIRMLSKAGAENWAAYAGPEVQPLPHGHLMTYPTW